MKNKVTFENAKGEKQVIKAYDFGKICLHIQNGELVHVDRVESIKTKGSKK